MASYHGAGIRDHAKVTGGTAYKNGLEIAASAASGRAVTNLEDIKQWTSWRAADLDPGNTRLLYQMAKRQPIGAVVAAGAEEMTGPDDAVRIRWGKWAEKPAAPRVDGKTDLAGDPITETESWTIRALIQLSAPNLQTSTDDVCELRNHATTSSSTTRLVQVAVGAAGNPLIRLERFGGASNEQDFTTAAQIDDCQPHLLEISFDGSGVSPFVATVYLDEISIGTVSTTEALGPESMCLATSGNHWVGYLELWNVALSASELAVVRPSLRDGRENDLQCGINFSETTMPTDTAADVTGNHDFTLSSSTTWGLITNPLADQSPASAPRWQAWRRRNALVCKSGGAGYVRTSASLSNSPLVHVMAVLRCNRRRGSGTPPMIRFGNSSPAGSYDWVILMRNNGQLIFEANKYHVSNEAAIFSDSAIDDGSVLRVSARIGWGGAMSMSIDGVEQADTDTAPAFSGQSSERMYLHVGSYDFEIGYLCVSSRPYTHAEADSIMKGETPLFANDPGVELLYHLHEGTGLSIPNALGAAAGTDGDLTITSADDASWDVDAIDNPSPGALRGDLASRANQVFLEIAPGIDYDAEEILVELYAPGAANAPTVYSLYAYECVWALGATVDADASNVGISGGDETGVGPPVEFSPWRVPFGAPDDTGRQVAYVFPLLSPEEATNLAHHALEARRTRRNGASVLMRPMLLIYRTEDRWRWPETCALVIPDEPRKTLDGSQSTAWEYALQISGDELKYGSDL